jgi:diguanylate cyclase (GGDEF)-like protein/PAS domain S-box-containing protein
MNGSGSAGGTHLFVDGRITEIVRALKECVGGTAAYLVARKAPHAVFIADDDRHGVARTSTAWLEAFASVDEAVRSCSECSDSRHARFAAFAVDVFGPCIVLIYGDAHFAVHPTQVAVVRTLLRLLRVIAPGHDSANVDGERLRLLESVVVNCSDAVMITEAEPIDLPGPRIVYANPAFTRMTGYELADVVGRTPRFLQGIGTDGAARALLRSALATWQPVEVELMNYKKDGSTFWVDLSIVPVADDAGHFTHWVSVQRETTERRIRAYSVMRSTVVEEQRAFHEADIQARDEVEAQLERAAYTDILTGLPNRALSSLRLEAELANVAVDADACFSVLFLDLDQFKAVNDSLGHRFGDLFLIAVSRRLGRCIRDGDTLARVGGDEFILIVKGSLETGRSVADRIVEAFSKPFELEHTVVPGSASIGIAFVDRRSSAGDVLRDADCAMYRAKQLLGGATYVVFDASMQETIVSRARREIDLRGAVVAGELLVAYQPIVDLRTGSVSGAEALVRWQHPYEGLLAPDRFIPLAEASGAIVAIGAFVLDRACTDFARLATHHATLYVSVNVSARELERGNEFVDNLRATLERTGIDAARVHIEITESVSLASLDGTIAVIERIRTLGCRVAFDDFGTGYSNLGYLARFPIDVLKLDKVFVAGIERIGVARRIMRTMVSLAGALEVRLVVEGVETAEQARILRRIGCFIHQGFYYGRPVAIERLGAEVAEIEARLAGARPPDGNIVLLTKSA